MRTGDRVLIGCGGRIVEGEVVLASENGVSLMIAFEAILDGHVGMMPVLREDDGGYKAVLTGAAVTIQPNIFVDEIEDEPGRME